jgi:hypothetical protein
VGIGGYVYYTARVTGTNPTGSIRFTDNGIAIENCGSVALTGAGDTRTAYCPSVGSASAGTHSVVARYGGDAANMRSTSNLVAEVVTRAPAIYVPVDSFASPASATMMLYSPELEVLVLKKAAEAIVAVDIETKEATTRLARYSFTDMSLSPSGRYLFATDYVSDWSGLPNYVHRIDLADMTADTRRSYFAGNIQAVTDTQVFLKSRVGWVSFGNASWGNGDAETPLIWLRDSYQESTRATSAMTGAMGACCMGAATRRLNRFMRSGTWI